jgi:putative hemolysin
VILFLLLSSSTYGLEVDSDGWYSSQILDEKQCEDKGGDWALGRIDYGCRLSYEEASEFCQEIGGRLPSFDEMSELWYAIKSDDPLANVDTYYAPKGFIADNYLTSEVVPEEGQTDYVRKIQFSFYSDEPNRGSLTFIDGSNGRDFFRCKSDTPNATIANETYEDQPLQSATFIAINAIDALSCSADFGGTVEQSSGRCLMLKEEASTFCASQGGRLPTISEVRAFWEQNDRAIYPNVPTLPYSNYWVSDVKTTSPNVLWNMEVGGLIAGLVLQSSAACVAWSDEEAGDWIDEMVISAQTCEDSYKGTLNPLTAYDYSRGLCKMSWQDAKQYCSSIGGRLPSVAELTNGFADDTVTFASPNNYWSSEDSDIASSKVTVNANGVSYKDINAYTEVRCIVGASEVTSQSNSNDPSSDMLQIAIKDGWNLLGNPQTSSYTLQNSNIEVSWAYANNAWSNNPNSIDPCSGFWVKATAQSSIDFASDGCQNSTSELSIGWNLLGAGTDIADPKSTLSAEVVWSYSDNSWSQDPDVVSIGSGFWVKMATTPSEPIDTTPSDSTTTRAILKTGQTKSYDGDGNEVTDSSIKDDGYYQKGIARSYSKQTEDSALIKDNATGLLWQNDSGAYGNGANETKTTSEALSYCSALILEGKSDWRLPTASELLDLVDYSQFNIALDDAFESMQYTNYATANFNWSSSTKMSDGITYYMVSFGEIGGMFSESYNGRYVRCVEGESASEKEDISEYFSKDESKGVVVDSSTNLMWEDGESAGELSWMEAIAYCEDLSYGGYDDWRLPNINELRSIFDPSVVVSDYWSYRKMYSGFSSYMRPNGIWSSTTEAYNTNGAYYIDFYNGEVSRSGKSTGIKVHGARCVREVQ